MVSIGVAVATVTDLQFHFFGACVAVAWIVPSAVNKILWSNLQQQENWTALAYHTLNLFSSLQFLVFCSRSRSRSCSHHCFLNKTIVQANVEDDTYYIILPVDDDAIT